MKRIVNWLIEFALEILDFLDEIKVVIFVCVVLIGSIALLLWLGASKDSNNKIILDGNLWKCTAENNFTYVQNIQVGNVSVPQVITVSECTAYTKK